MLTLVPCTLREACSFVQQLHRHHAPDEGALFAVAAADCSSIVGVAVIGRPKARLLQNGWTAEVTRCCVKPGRLAGLLLWRTLGLAGALWVLREAPRAGALLAAAGVRNACSMLYGAAWRAARALGYRRLITYTLPVETGESLKGAGWRCIGEAGGGSWDRRERPRVDTHPTQRKLRWEVSC